MRNTESQLIRDSKVFDGKDLQPFLRTNLPGVDKKNDLNAAWGAITRSMPSLQDSPYYAFVNRAIVWQIQDYIRRFRATAVLDILGGGHSFVESDVIDASRQAMNLNPNAREKHQHDVNRDPAIDEIVGKNRYNLITVINGMAYIRKPRELLTAAHRSLKYRGKIVIGFDTRYEEDPATYLWHMISEIMRDKFGAKGPPKGKFDFQLDMRWRRAVVAHWLKQAGFKNIDADLLPIPWNGRYCGAGAEQTEFSMIIGEKS